MRSYPGEIPELSRDSNNASSLTFLHLPTQARGCVMSARIDLFYNTYANFTDQVLAAGRRKTYGRDIGQNSWVTADEYRPLHP